MDLVTIGTAEVVSAQAQLILTALVNPQPQDVALVYPGNMDPVPVEVMSLLMEADILQAHTNLVAPLATTGMVPSVLQAAMKVVVGQIQRPEPKAGVLLRQEAVALILTGIMAAVIAEVPLLIPEAEVLHLAINVRV